MRMHLLFLMLLAVPLATVIAQPFSDTQVRKKAAEDFNASYDNQWKMRWDEKTGTLASLIGHQSVAYGGASNEAALAFLEAEKNMFGLLDLESDLSFLKQSETRNGHFLVRFEQRYKGIPVLFSGYVLSVDQKGAVHSVSGDYYPDLAVSTTPGISPQSSIEKVRLDLASEQVTVNEEPELSIYVDTETDRPAYFLAYHTRVQAGDPALPWEYLIDAHDGEVLRKTSLVRDVNGTGTVYKTNPLHGGTITATLHRLRNITPRMLDGDNVVVLGCISDWLISACLITRIRS